MDIPDQITTIISNEKKADKRVIVAGTGSALDEGIKSLLMREPELKLATAAYSDPTAFLKEVAQVSPDVIVVSETGSLDWNWTSALLHGLLPRQALRLIVIRLEDNILEVYVNYLRKKTEAGSEPRLIQTVRGVGYVLREEP